MRGLLIILLLITWLWSTAQETLEMSLDDCIQYALKNNEQIAIAKFENEIAETEIGETLSLGLPQVNAQVDVINNTRIPLSPLPGDLAGSEDDFVLVPLQTQYSSTPSIGLSQMIFDGSFFVGLEASRTLRELRVKETERTEIDIIEAVSKAYYAVLINEANLVQLKENLGRLDTLLYETTALYENGFAELIDVSRIKIQQNNLSTDLKNTSDQLVITLSLLKFQMGMPINQSIILSETLNSDKFEPLLQGDSNTEYQYEDRIDYSILQTNYDLTLLDVKNNRAQRMPNIYLNYNLGWNAFSEDAGDIIRFSETDPFPVYNRFSNIGFSLSVPLFDGLRKRNLIQRAEIQGKQIKSSMKLTENQIDLEVEQSTINYNNALRDLKTQEENTLLAKQVYEVTKTKYNEGIGANLEVIEADNDYKQAQTNYLNALYEVINSQIELKKALGILNK